MKALVRIAGLGLLALGLVVGAAAAIDPLLVEGWLTLGMGAGVLGVVLLGLSPRVRGGLDYLAQRGREWRGGLVGFALLALSLAALAAVDAASMPPVFGLAMAVGAIAGTVLLTASIVLPIYREWRQPTRDARRRLRRPALFLRLLGLGSMGLGVFLPIAAALVTDGDAGGLGALAMILCLGVGSALLAASWTLGPLYDWLRGRSVRQDRAFLAAGLADLLDLGVPADEALDRLADDMAGPLHTRLSEAASQARETAEALRRGTDLPRAGMEAALFPRGWKPVLVAAESGGRLPQALRRLADLDLRLAALPVEGALRLGLALLISFLVGYFLVTFILPTFVQLFEGMSLQLPFLTRSLIGTVKVLRTPWVWLATFWLVVASVAWPPLRQRWEALLLGLPGIREVARGRVEAGALLALRVAAEQGLPAREALRLAATTTGNRRLQEALERSAGKAGGSLSTFLRAHPQYFSPTLAWLVLQGERLDRLPEVLAEASRHLEADLLDRRRRLSVLIQTGVTVSVAVMVAWMAVGSLLPLYSLAGTLVPEALLP